MDNILLYRGNGFNANFFRYSGLDVDNSFYLKAGKKEILFVPKLNERAAKLSFRGEVRAYKKPVEEILALVRGKQVHMDFSTLPAWIYERLRKGVRAKDGSDEFLASRAAKKPEEIKKMAKAVRATKKIFSEIGLGDFKTEKELASHLVARTYELGFEPAFEPIVGSGLHSALPHYHPAYSKIKGFALVDYGVKYENYCADLTRVLFCGSGSREVRLAYETAQSIFHEIIDAFPDCETGRDVALFSEKAFVKYKFPKLIHSIGHGIGLDVHEYPRLSKKYEDPLKGTTLAIEPAAYFKNFGVRFEETIYFDGKKAKVL